MPLVKPKDNLPLNEYLAQRRKFLKLRLGDLSQKINIASKYLKWIENGDWQNLPPDVYTRGFLKKYAQAVGLDESEILFRYEEEQILFKNKDLKNQKPDFLTIRQKNSFSFKIFNSKALNFLSRIETRYIVVLITGLIVVGYIVWQLRVIFVIPDLAINFPLDETIFNQTTLILDGRASIDSTVTVNGESIFSQPDGSFKKETQLLPGVNILEIKAVSRFGKEKKIIRRVTYQP